MNQKFIKIKYIRKSNTVKNMKLMILTILQPTHSKCFVKTFVSVFRKKK